MKEAKTFNVVECAGTPYEIGRQWGEGCRDNILKALDMTIGGLSFGYNTTKEDIIANAMKFYPKVKDFDQDLIELLKGQAEGAGVGFEEVFALKCGFDLGGYYNKLSGLCTSFAATGKATASGKTVLGQNIDWYPGTPLDLVKIVHPDGSKQLSLVLWGIVEYTLSSAGFGMCANGTWVAAEKCLLNVPIGCYLPRAMRQKTLGEAMEVLRSTARGLGYYHLASADKEMVGIESVQDDYEIILPEREMLAHSNHYLTDRFKAVDMVDVIIPDSRRRVERMRDLLNQNYGRITPEIGMEMLTDHDNHPYSICRHVDENAPPQFHSASVGSFIMVPEDGIMYVAAGNPCEFEYVGYQL